MATVSEPGATASWAGMLPPKWTVRDGWWDWTPRHVPSLELAGGVPSTVLPPVPHVHRILLNFNSVSAREKSSKKFIRDRNGKGKTRIINIVRKEKPSSLPVWVKSFMYWHLTFIFEHFFDTFTILLGTAEQYPDLKNFNSSPKQEILCPPKFSMWNWEINAVQV